MFFIIILICPRQRSLSRRQKPELMQHAMALAGVMHRQSLPAQAGGQDKVVMHIADTRARRKLVGPAIQPHLRRSDHHQASAHSLGREIAYLLGQNILTKKQGYA